MKNSFDRIYCLVCLVTCLFISGCMPSTINDLKNTGVHDSFFSSAPYQHVYREVSHMLHNCVPGGFLQAQNKIDDNLYPDLNLGEITVSNNNMGDRSVMLYVEIRGKSSGTFVDVYSADVGMWSDYPEHLRALIINKRLGCP